MSFPHFHLLLRGLVFSFIIFFSITPWTAAQEEVPQPAADAPAPAGESGGPVLRLGFMEMLHQTFWTEEDHPFYQMTGSNRFRGGKGYSGIPALDPTDISFPDGISANVNSKRRRDGDGHSNVDSFIGKLMDWLPTFSLEYVFPTDYWVGAGFAFHYTNIWLDDTKIRAATTGSDPSYDTPLLRMFSRFYMASASVYPLGPPQPGGIDFFWGFGLAHVETTLHYGIRPNPEIYNTYEEAFFLQTDYQYSAALLSFQRFGLASTARNFGFMLEFLRLYENEVIDNPFKNQTYISSAAYNETYNDRGGTLPDRAGMAGMITRASWTYSFR